MVQVRPIGFADIIVNTDEVTLNFRDPDLNVLKEFITLNYYV